MPTTHIIVGLCVCVFHCMLSGSELVRSPTLFLSTNVRRTQLILPHQRIEIWQGIRVEFAKDLVEAQGRELSVCVSVGLCENEMLRIVLSWSRNSYVSIDKPSGWMPHRRRTTESHRLSPFCLQSIRMALPQHICCCAPMRFRSLRMRLLCGGNYVIYWKHSTVPPRLSHSARGLHLGFERLRMRLMMVICSKQLTQNWKLRWDSINGG